VSAAAELMPGVEHEKDQKVGGKKTEKRNQ
jgi:hypothetical protein